MLNPFPDLLVFGLVAPFILRVTIGVLFVLLGFAHITKEREALLMSFTARWGSLGTFFVWYLAFFEIIVGLFLIIGFLTQIAAIAGAITAAQILWFRRQFREFAKYPTAFYILLLATSLSLLFSGAGFLAFDLPL